MDPDTGIGTGTATDVLALGDLKAAALLLWANPEFPGSRVLWDLRHAWLALSPQDVRELARFVKAERGPRTLVRMAFLVTGDAELGLLHMLNAHWEELRVRAYVTRDHDDALRWLRDDQPEDSDKPDRERGPR